MTWPMTRRLVTGLAGPYQRVPQSKQACVGVQRFTSLALRRCARTWPIPPTADASVLMPTVSRSPRRSAAIDMGV